MVDALGKVVGGALTVWLEMKSKADGLMKRFAVRPHIFSGDG